MLIEGKLERWNDERGFGFIVPFDGGEDIFVHVSAFPHDGRRPQNGERLTFSIEIDAGGRKRARDVRRPPAPEHPSVRAAPPDRQRRPSRLGGLLLALLVGSGVYGYQRLRQPPPAAVEAAASLPLAARPEAAPSFSCDGRTRCRQMTSCAEARYFLQHCPGVEMDGDHDGTPCEDALCGH